MNKNLLQKPTQSFTKKNTWSKTGATLLFFILVCVNLTQAQSPTLAWAKGMGGTVSDVGRSIAVDGAGNVYTTGYFSGTVDFDPNAGVSNLTSAGSVDIFVSKLDARGNLLWAKGIGGISAEIAYGIAVDATGNVYTTGYFTGTVDFDPNAGVSNLTTAGGIDIFVSKLDTTGNLVWAKAMGGTGADSAIGIAVDITGDVYTTGYFNGTADFDPNAGVLNLTSAAFSDIFVSKIDASGTFVWAKAMGGTSGDQGKSVVVDGVGNVYTTGSFQGTADFDPNAGVLNFTTDGNDDIFVSKLDATGNLVWAKKMGGSTNDTGNSIVVDATGNVYTTGSFSVTVDFDPNSGVSNLTVTGAMDIFVSKLDASGNFVWAKAMGGTSFDIGLGIALDATGNIYTTGHFQETADFNPNAGVSNLTAAGFHDIFVSKLDATGTFAWAKAMGGSTGNDYGYGIAVNGGNVHTTGYFNGTVDFDPNAGVSNLISAGGDDIFVHKMNVTAAALRFDGVNDYVNCGNSASYNLTGSLSIEAYINRSILNTDDCIVGKDNFASSTGYSFWVYQNNKLIFRLGNREYTSTSTISQNTWTHVAATFNAGIVNLYINGVLDATFSGVAPPVSNSNGLYIGTPQDALGNSLFAFSGTIDEVRLWNRALPQTEIMNNMNCELPTGQTGLLSYYQFNQGANGANNSTVTALTDASGDSNTGTLTNFALSGTTSNWVLPGGVTTGNTCSTFLSTNDFAFTSNISVYPNPSKDIFSINSDAIGSIVIYDLNGKIIETENLDLGITKLDLSNYPNGIYLMKVINDSNQTKIIKLIKE